MAPARDPLPAAVAAHWRPLLKANGFRKYSIPEPHIRGTRRKKHVTFGRVRGDIFQYFDLSAGPAVLRGGLGFDVRCTTLLVARIHDDVYSTVTKFLEPMPDEIGNDDWPAATHDQADASMKAVVEQAETVALPWLDAVATVAGLARELETQAPAGNPHALFELACCRAVLGDLAGAETRLAEAVAGFRTEQSRNNYGTSAGREQERAEALLAAIAAGKHARVLSEWREITTATLQLHPLLD